MDGTMTWDEMENRYPGQWVAVKDALMDGSDIVSGVVVAVRSDDDISDFRAEHQGEHLRFRRTTEDYDYGIINSNITIKID